MRSPLKRLVALLALLSGAAPLMAAPLPLAKELSSDELRARLRPGRTKELEFVFTSDVHGHIRQEGKWGGQGALDGLLRWRKASRRDDAKLLVLDGGDLFQGTPETNLNKGQAMIRMANALGLDAYTLGNHDFDYGREALEARMAEVRFPVLGANLRLRATGRRPAFVKPWVVLPRQGLRIAIVGLCSADEGTYERQALGDFTFTDPVEAARNAVDELKARGGWDLLVALTHLGLDRSLPLAEAVPDFDLVFDGHSHQQTFTPLRSSTGTLVMQAGAKARHAGRLRLLVDERSRRPLMADWHLSPLLAGSFPPTEGVSELVASVTRQTDAIMDRPVAPLSFSVPSENWGAHNPLGALVTDAFLWWGRKRLSELPTLDGVDCALMINGGIRASLDTTPAGCTLRQVFNVLPFDNHVCLRRIRGRDLRQFIESSLRGEFLPKNRRKWLAQVAGMEFHFDPRLPEGSRITKLLIAGRSMDEEKRYTVVLDSFLAEGGGGMLAMDRIERPEGPANGPFNRDVLAAYLKEHARTLRITELTRPRVFNALFPPKP